MAVDDNIVSSQFTSTILTTRLLNRNIAASLDGRGRTLDNVFIERLWRNTLPTVKYEEDYLHDYKVRWNAEELLVADFDF